MPSLREDLLSPSLAREAYVARAPYSTTAMLLVSFFGGAPAALAMFGLDTWRLGRMRRDAPWLAIAFAVTLGWAWARWHPGFGDALRGWLGFSADAVLLRLLGLLIFGLALWRHRSEQRSTDLLGLARPNPWIVGIGLVIAGRLLDAALVVGVA